MNPLIQLKTITPPLLITLTLLCFGLSPATGALHPPPDGGYGGANTAEGTGALNNLVIPFRGEDGGERNTALGFQTLLNLTLGDDNTATGYQALFSNITGIGNTATGVGALRHNTVNGNTADGYQALFNNTTGEFNTAHGFIALQSNVDGSCNTAIGSEALFFGNNHNNTAVGCAALANNGSEGSNGNTAVGSGALNFNTGSHNTALGDGAIGFIGGSENTAVGALAMASGGFFAGSGNTAIGFRALHGVFLESVCDHNTAVGHRALVNNTNGNGNTAIGQDALFHNTTGGHNTALGQVAGFNVTTASNVICIGAIGQNVSNSCYIENIFGQTSGDGVPVFVNSANKLGTTTSSKRFKQDIRPLGETSGALFSLKPVAFRYNKEIDPAGRSQFGLVAEDVEKVNPHLVVRDKEGKPYSVRYDQVNAMLLNEFLKEHRKNEEQEATIARLQKQIEALTAGLQKVSTQLEASKPASQVAENDY